MALVHEFILVEDDFDIKEVDSTLNAIPISDQIIKYISDTLNWVTMYWNNKKDKNGLNYYGYTVIREREIEQFKKLIICWIELFEIAPDEFCLKGDYSYDEDDYEKIILRKMR